MPAFASSPLSILTFTSNRSNQNVTGIGGKWKTVVLWYLKGGTLRFSELKKRIPDITEKMLSIQLKTLEADGLIERKVYGVKPPVKVEYSLTEFGETLIETLNAIAKWGRDLGEKEGKMVALEDK